MILLAVSIFPVIRPVSSFRRKGSFSIVELLVAMAVLSLLVVIVASITASTFKLWRSTAGSIKMFSSARTAFAIVGARLGQATLNPYLDYYNSSWQRRSSSLANLVTFVPTYYGRASDLHFYCGPATNALSIPQAGLTQQGHGVFFFAPLGYSNNTAAYADVPTLLNAIGYYVEFGSDLNYRPAFLGTSFPQKYRWRLIENILPTQYFTNYPSFTTAPVTYANYMQWMNTSLESPNSVKSVLADNVIALIVRPEMSQQDATTVFGSGANPWNLTTNYIYDSQTLTGVLRPNVTTATPTALWYAQLPPLLRVVIVAVDEASARRLTTGTTSPAAFQLKSTWFQTPANLTNDINSLSQQLNTNHVSYQIFNQLIPIRGAEFSTQVE